jgi:hypothetical protein
MTQHHTHRKCVREAKLQNRFLLGIQSSPNAVDGSQDLDAHRADERELPSVRPRPVQQRPNASHNVLWVPRPVECNRRQGAINVGQGPLPLFVLGKGGVMLVSRDLSRGIARREMQLIRCHEHGLRDVEGGVLRRRNSHQDVSEVDCFVGEPVVLLPKKQRDSPLPGFLEHHRGEFPRLRDRPAVGTPLGAEGGDVYAIGQGLLKRGEVPDAVHEVTCAVGNTLNPPRIIRNRLHEPEVHESKVLHHAHRGGDVDGVLWLIQHNGDAMKQRHPPKIVGA